MSRERINKELIVKVGKHLRQVRKDRNLSQERVIDDTKIKVGRYERGEVNISLTTLSLLCDHYGLSLKQFFEGMEG